MTTYPHKVATSIFFATNMAGFGCWDAPYKAGLRRVLDALGAPLAAAYAAEGLRDALGALTLPAHALVAADAARCAAAGRPHKLRCDIDGIVPLLAAWRFDEGDPAARQWHERVFIHKLRFSIAEAAQASCTASLGTAFSHRGAADA